MQGDMKLEKVKLALLTMIRHPWEHGVASQAFIESGDEKIAVLMAHEAVYRQLADGRLAGIYHTNNITDPCACGESVMYAFLKTKDIKYKIAAEKMLFYIDHAPCTDDGIQFHNYDEPMIAADCMYMVAPFYAVMGRFDDAVKQIDKRFNLLWNEEKGAMNHQWDAQNKRLWRDKRWGAASGWNAAAIVRVMKMLPGSMETEHKRLKEYLNKIISGVLKYQLENGLFYDILDEGSTSFIETNNAQMMAYSIYTGVAAGFLSNKYIPAANKMRAAAHDKVDDMGFVQGVAGAPAFDFYGISPEGQAFYILMEAAVKEYERAQKA